MKIVRIIARLNIGGPARNTVLLSQAWQTVLVSGETGLERWQRTDFQKIG